MSNLEWTAFVLQQVDSEKVQASRNGNSSKRAAITSSVKPRSSGEFTEGRSGRIVSSSGRLSTTQRIQPGTESKPSKYSRNVATKGTRDDALRSFDFLSIRK